MDENEAEADCKSCEIACAGFGISCSKNYQHKKESGDDLYKASAPYAAGISNTVGAKCTGEIRSGNNICNKQKNCTCKYTANYLAGPIATGFFPAHSAAECYTQGDSGVNVAAADSAYGVSHSNYGKTKSNSCSNYSGRSGAAQEHGGAATEESEDKCAQTLCNVFLHIE